jgi:ABC-type polysaccharide/polyol phosphate export permease
VHDLLSFARELSRHRELLLMLTWRDIRIKYKQTVLGFLWALLMPILIVSAGLVVKLGVAQVSGRGLQWSELATVAVKALPWAFFTSTLRFATLSLTNNTSLVTKIAFPRAVFPVAATLSQAFDAAIASVVVVALLVLARTGVSAALLWVPLLLLLLGLFTSALALFLSAANLFFRDVKYVVEVVITFAIFFSPVFYEVSMFGRWADVLMLNPLAPLLEGLAAAVVHHQAPHLGWLAYSAGVTLLLSAVAPIVFVRLEPRFAESI